MSRALTIAYIFDNLLLALLTLGNCQVGETLSSKAWSLEVNGRLQGRIFRPLIDWLFSAMEPDHCLQAYRSYLRITGATR